MEYVVRQEYAEEHAEKVKNKNNINYVYFFKFIIYYLLFIIYYKVSLYNSSVRALASVALTNRGIQKYGTI